MEEVGASNAANVTDFPPIVRLLFSAEDHRGNGRVQGQPLPGGNAWLASPLDYAVTDAEGHFRLVGLTKGRVRLNTSAPSEAVVHRPVPIQACAEVQAGQQDVQLALKLPPEERNSERPRKRNAPLAPLSLLK